MKRTSWSSSPSVISDGVGVVAHAGQRRNPRLLGDRTGLTVKLSKAMLRRDFVPARDVELTWLLDLNNWSTGIRVAVRGERPHAGGQLSLFEEADGWCYQALVTNTKHGQLAFLEARHPAPGQSRGPDPALVL